MKLQEEPEQERPRERLLRLGPESLKTAELLAIILQTGTNTASVVEFANEILRQRPLNILERASVHELQTIPGIGIAKACTIQAVFELGRRTKKPLQNRQKIRNAKEVFKVKEQLQYLTQEECHILILDTKNTIIATHLIARGTINTTIIHPREVFVRAIKEQANSIIVVHNHPTGDPTPSNEDKIVTKQLFETGKIIGIELLDHVIIGKKYYSFKEEGELD
ncbi:MAG: RadC family protein [Nanobdellota archaeon]